MPSPSKAADITTFHRSPNAAERHHRSRSSTAPSAARLAAEAAFSDMPRAATVERDDVFAPTTLAAWAPVLATQSAETSVESRPPRVFLVSRVALAIPAAEAPSAGITAPESADHAAGLEASSPEIEGAPSPQVLRPVRRRHRSHATLSGPVTVISPPDPATPAPERSAAKSAAAVVLPLTLNQLRENLAAVGATLEDLRRVPVWDFQVRPNQKAWSRLSREADKLLVDIRSARRR
jgi:hypothetical protein